MGWVSRSSSVNSAEPTSLRDMVYSGRGITLGMTPNRTPFAGYTLSGRSPSSKARKLYPRTEDGRVVIATEATDPEVLQKGNPALLIYPVILFDGRKLAISNGVQTELAMKAPLPSALEVPVFVGNIDVTSYEPDAPNYTPRITGELNDEQNWVSVFNIVKKADGSINPVRETYRYELKPGAARTMTTYAGDNESPLLPFIGAPMETSMPFDNPQELCRHLFSELRGTGSADYRVSSAVLMWGANARGDQMADISIINASDNSPEPHNSQFYLRRAQS